MTYVLDSRTRSFIRSTPYIVQFCTDLFCTDWVLFMSNVQCWVALFWHGPSPPSNPEIPPKDIAQSYHICTRHSCSLLFFFFSLHSLGDCMVLKHTIIGRTDETASPAAISILPVHTYIHTQRENPVPCRGPTSRERRTYPPPVSPSLRMLLDASRVALRFNVANEDVYPGAAWFVEGVLRRQGSLPFVFCLA